VTVAGGPRGGRGRGAKGAAAGPREKAPLRQRARAFVFDGQGEHERFGVFDPTARMTFAVGVLTAAILAGLGAAESMGTGSRAAAAALGLVVAGALAVAGFLAYRRIWVPPPEREVLLQLAREEDESKALAAARDRARDAERARERAQVREARK